MTLADVWKKIQAEGPAYVLLDKDGRTEMTTIARQKDPDLTWDMIYIRNDGYSLACSFYLGHYAENMHRKEWVGVVRRGDKMPRAVQYA